MATWNLGECAVCRDHVTTAQAFFRLMGRVYHWACYEKMLARQEEASRPDAAR